VVRLRLSERLPGGLGGEPTSGRFGEAFERVLTERRTEADDHPVDSLTP